MNFYCISVRTGMEENFKESVKDLLSPNGPLEGKIHFLKKQMRLKNGKEYYDPFFPGYVFLETQERDPIKLRKTLPPLFTLKSRNKPLIKQRPEHSCFNFKIRLNNRPGPSYIRLRRPYTDCRWPIQRLYRKSSSSKPPQQKSKHRNRFYGLPASGKPVLRISGEKINVKIPKIKCIF